MRQTTFWQLSLSAAGSGSTTSEYRQFYGDGTSGPTTYGSHTSATAYVNAANINGGTASAWISATLSGVDAADAGGQRIASASFGSDGTGRQGVKRCRCGFAIYRGQSHMKVAPVIRP